MIRKTAAITAASIAGVILAGGVAVGANIGILNAADNSNLGDLSAEFPVTTAPTAVENGVERTAEFLASRSNQWFTVDVAGEVEVDTEDSGLRIGDVRTNPGWSYEELTTTEGTVSVSFSSGDDILIFTARTNRDGTISAGVDRPLADPTATSGTVDGPESDDDDDDHDEYESRDDDHDDHDEYESRDDDHDEYEGRDDDD